MKTPENNNTSLVPQQPLFPILEKQGRQLAIVEKLLAESVRKKILQFALSHPDSFISIISSCHPLTPVLIKKHKDKWEWICGLARNKSVYQKVFRPYLTDSFTDEIMNKIKNA